MQGKTYVLGVGCRRGASAQALSHLATAVLREAGVQPEALAAVATIRGKEEEPAVHALARLLDLPVRTFPPERLEAETPRLLNPSEIVFRETGCHGVAEAAALAEAGPAATLVVPKRSSYGCTVALAGAAW